MGTAMAAGLAVINTQRMQMTGEWEIQTACDAAIAAFDQELLAFQDAGGIVEMMQWQHLPSLIDRAIRAYSMSDPIPVTWLVRGVEQAFPDHGNCRPDLIIENDWGVAPVDYKMKESLYVRNGETKEAARFRTLLEHKDSWQMLHYVWALRQTGQKCDRYYICLGELGPKPAFTLQSFEVSDETLEMWLHSANVYWFDMDEIDHDEFRPAMAANHRNQYGLCEYYKACFEHRLDENLMGFDYVKVERRSSGA
jgi:hypothetical protein